MFHLDIGNHTDKNSFYSELTAQTHALLSGERDWLANMAQFAALIFYSLPEINWAGFYLYKEQQLIVGPFQGKPACVRIAMGKGVCGSSATTRETIIVPDVEVFAGHIVCDSDSRSEIVLPLIKNQQLLGVFDIDSPKPSRFDETDAKHLSHLISFLLEASAI